MIWRAAACRSVLSVFLLGLIGCVAVDIPTKRGSVEVLIEWHDDCLNPKAPKRVYGCEAVASSVVKVDREAAVPWAARACRAAFEDPAKPSLEACSLLWNLLDVPTLRAEDRTLAEAAARRFLETQQEGHVRDTLAYLLWVRYPGLWERYVERRYVRKACERSGALAEAFGGEAPCERAKRLDIAVDAKAYADGAGMRGYESQGLANVAGRVGLLAQSFVPECFSHTDTSACRLRNRSGGALLAGESLVAHVSRSDPALAARYAHANCDAALADENLHDLSQCAPLWSFARQPFVDAGARRLAEHTARLYLATGWRIMDDLPKHATYTLLTHYPELFKSYAAARPIGSVCEGGDDRPRYDEYGEATRLGESACSRAARLGIEIDRNQKATLAKMNADYEREARRQHAARRAQDAESRRQMTESLVAGIQQTAQLEQQNAAVAEQQQRILERQALRDRARMPRSHGPATGTAGRAGGSDTSSRSDPAATPSTLAASGTPAAKTSYHCRNLSQSVRGSAQYKKGLGRCKGEVVGKLENGSAESLTCTYCLTASGSSDKSTCQKTDLAPNESKGGELAGMWWCDRPSGAGIAWYCMAAKEYDYACLPDDMKSIK